MKANAQLSGIGLNPGKHDIVITRISNAGLPGLCLLSSMAGRTSLEEAKTKRLESNQERQVKYQGQAIR